MPKLLDANIPIGAIQAAPFVSGGLGKLVFPDDLSNLSGALTDKSNVFPADRDFNQFVLTPGVHQKSFIHRLSVIALDQPGVTIQLGPVGFVYFVIPLGKFVVERRHRAVFQQQNLVYLAPQQLIGEVLPDVLFLHADPLAQVFRILTCFLIMYISPLLDLEKLILILRYPQDVLEIGEPRTVEVLYDLRWCNAEIFHTKKTWLAPDRK